jgi:hypothetical protein
MVSALRKASRSVLTKFIFIAIPIIVVLNAWLGVSNKRLIFRTHSLNAYDQKLDWQAAGITVASDGKCYFACSSHAHDHGATFFQYDPRADRLTVLCDDVTRICGENPQKTPPQGKIRSDIVEMDGRLYFGTHLANYWRDAEAAYTGGHVVSFHLETGEFHDYGVFRSNYTILSGIALDRVRYSLYVYVTRYPHAPDSRLYRINLSNGLKEDLGVVHEGMGFVYHLFVDQKGDCWFSSTGAGGIIFHFDASSRRLYRREDSLPPCNSWENLQITDRKRAIRWIHPLANGFCCVFTMEGSDGCSGDVLWRLDSTKDKKDAVSRLKRIGQTGLGLFLIGGRVYFVQHSYAKPAQIKSRLLQRRLTQTVNKLISFNACPSLHLRSVELSTGAISDHGIIVDQEGRRPIRIDSLAVSGKGWVFMVGDWQSRKEKSMLYDHKRERYVKLPYAQFFAVVRLPDSKSQ